MNEFWVPTEHAGSWIYASYWRFSGVRKHRPRISEENASSELRCAAREQCTLEKCTRDRREEELNVAVVILMPAAPRRSWGGSAAPVTEIYHEGETRCYSALFLSSF